MAHPRMYEDSSPAIKRLRTICLALPAAFEKEAWGECTFRVTGGSMFAMTDNDHHRSGHVAVWVKAPAMAQEILVHADPTRFFVPPYVGAKGWVGVRLYGEVDWAELAEILKDGYRLSAPTRLRGRVGSAVDEISGVRKTRRSAPISRTTAALKTKPIPTAKPRSKKATRVRHHKTG